MKSQNKKVGKEGEDLACDFLMRKGYEVLKRNYRYMNREIDIICRHQGLIVFVEVKTRRSALYGEPEVSPRQISFLESAAEEFLEEIAWNDEIRFDLISVYLFGKTRIEHIEEAF